MVEYNRFSVGNFTVQEQVTTGNFVIYLIELILCFFVVLANFMFLIVLFKAELLHRNLRIILFSTCLANALYATSRYFITIPLIIAYLFNSEISSVTFCWAAKSFHHLVLGVPGLTFFFVILERCIASYHYQTYEKHSFYQSGYLLVTLQWLTSLFIVVINQVDVANQPRPYSRLPCQIEYSTSRCLFFAIGLFTGLNIIACILFWKMTKFNRKLYKQRSWKLKTLSETFQVSENVKSIKILNPLLIVVLISNLIAMFIVGLQATLYLLVRETPEAERAALTKQLSIQIVGRGSEASQSYDIVSAISKLVFCYAIRSHPILNRKWCQIFSAGRKSSVAPSFAAKDRNEESDIHFDSLKLMWEMRMIN